MFVDRSQGGCQLARRLSTLGIAGDAVVLGLACSGVAVAYEVARELAAPLDVLVARRVFGPSVPRVALGAVTESGHVLLDPERVRRVGVGPDALREIVERELEEVEHWARRCRGGRARVAVHGRTVVIVDDGAAIGDRARLAVEAVRALGASRAVVAVPVVALAALDVLRRAADEVVYLDAPPAFIAVGYWYARFGLVSDVEVSMILERARRERHLWLAARTGTGPGP
jgi:putative phosphoribosyl transferase